MPAFSRRRPRFAHTPLFGALQRLLASAEPGRGAPRSGRPLAGARRGATRRDFLKLAGAASLALAGEAEAAVFHETAKVAIVGAGLAGLTAAHYLRSHRIAPYVYEAASRFGGRVQTAVDLLAPGVTTEFGGEFIHGDQATMLGLAAEFGFTLMDAEAPSEIGLEERSYFIGGSYYTEAQILDELSAAAAQIQTDRVQAGSNVSYRQHSRFAARLDAISVAEYLDGLELTSRVRTVLDTAYTTEFGLETGQQSSLNLITTLGTDLSQGQLQLFGTRDRKYRILGGNQQLANKLISGLRGRLKLEHRLESIRSHGTGYRLTFATPRGTVETDADFVLMCLPFSVLRNLDVRVALPAIKRAAIKNLGYATHTKLMVGLNEPVWRPQGRSGYLIADQPQMQGWDSSRQQDGDGAGYTFMLGGQAGVDAGTGTTASQLKPYVDHAELAFPGFSAARNGGLARAHWPGNPLSRGSYACYLTGQWTSLSGAEFAPVGKLYFAGEHASPDFQGTMEGAASTGLAAAQVIRRRIQGR